MSRRSDRLKEVSLKGEVDICGGHFSTVLGLSAPIMVLLGPPLTTWTEANGHPGVPYTYIGLLVAAIHHS